MRLRPPVVVLNKSLVPLQIAGPVSVGPAYRTFEEAFRNKAHSDCHIAEVVLSDENDREVAHWWEVSQSVDARGVGRAGDTEQKALVRVNLRPGYTMEIRGFYNPCMVGKDCDAAMQNAAINSGAEIIYRTCDGEEGNEFVYPRDDF